jgi:hypothetical protein
MTSFPSSVRRPRSLSSPSRCHRSRLLDLQRRAICPADTFANDHAGRCLSAPIAQGRSHPSERATEAIVKCTTTVTHIVCLEVGGLVAQYSGTVKTAHGDAIPRSACVPSGISNTPVSAASVPETRTALPSGRHSPSSRLTRLTAGPMAVKSSRSAAPILPQSISPRCRAAPKGRGASPCRRRASSRCAIRLPFHRAVAECHCLRGRAKAFATAP